MLRVLSFPALLGLLWATLTVDVRAQPAGPGVAHQPHHQQYHQQHHQQQHQHQQYQQIPGGSKEKATARHYDGSAGSRNQFSPEIHPYEWAHEDGQNYAHALPRGFAPDVPHSPASASKESLSPNGAWLGFAREGASHGLGAFTPSGLVLGDFTDEDGLTAEEAQFWVPKDLDARRYALTEHGDRSAEALRRDQAEPFGGAAVGHYAEPYLADGADEAANQACLSPTTAFDRLLDIRGGAADEPSYSSATDWAKQPQSRGLGLADIQQHRDHGTGPVTRQQAKAADRAARSGAVANQPPSSYRRPVEKKELQLPGYNYDGHAAAQETDYGASADAHSSPTLKSSGSSGMLQRIKRSASFLRRSNRSTSSAESAGATTAAALDPPTPLSPMSPMSPMSPLSVSGPVSPTLAAAAKRKFSFGKRSDAGASLSRKSSRSVFSGTDYSKPSSPVVASPTASASSFRPAAKAPAASAKKAASAGPMRKRPSMGLFKPRGSGGAKEAASAQSASKVTIIGTPLDAKIPKDFRDDAPGVVLPWALRSAGASPTTAVGPALTPARRPMVRVFSADDAQKTDDGRYVSSQQGLVFSAGKQAHSSHGDGNNVYEEAYAVTAPLLVNKRRQAAMQQGLQSPPLLGGGMSSSPADSVTSDQFALDVPSISRSPSNTNLARRVSPMRT